MARKRFRPQRQNPGRLALQLSALCGCPPWSVVCIGTDRSTGDALGPLTGSLLRSSSTPDLCVFGSVRSPIHAANLRDFVRGFQPIGPVVAVDACLGERRHIGTVSLCPDPLRPGAGIRKNLPEIGDLHVAGTVGARGFMEFEALQNARLNMVLSLASWIASSIEMGAQMSLAASTIRLQERRQAGAAMVRGSPTRSGGTVQPHQQL